MSNQHKRFKRYRAIKKFRGQLFTFRKYILYSAGVNEIMRRMQPKYPKGGIKHSSGIAEIRPTGPEVIMISNPGSGSLTLPITMDTNVNPYTTITIINKSKKSLNINAAWNLLSR